MKVKNKLNFHIIFITFIFLIIISGCSQKPITGVVVTKPSTFAEESYAPDITFTDLQGRLRDLSSFYMNANIIAFVGSECLEKSNPQLIQMASDLKYDVAVVEICSPKVESGKESPCRMTREIKEKNLITLCDKEGIARNGYRMTTPTAVFVLDSMGYIKAIGTIKDLEKLRQKAESIAAEEENWD